MWRQTFNWEVTRRHMLDRLTCWQTLPTALTYIKRVLHNYKSTSNCILCRILLSWIWSSLSEKFAAKEFKPSSGSTAHHFGFRTLLVQLSADWLKINLARFDWLRTVLPFVRRGILDLFTLFFYKNVSYLGWNWMFLTFLNIIVSTGCTFVIFHSHKSTESKSTLSH